MGVASSQSRQAPRTIACVATRGEWSRTVWPVFGTPLNSLLVAIRADNAVLDYVLYPTYFIHGIIGALWWGFLPRVYAWCKWRWEARRNDVRRPN